MKNCCRGLGLLGLATALPSLACAQIAGGSAVEIARAYTIDSHLLGERRTVDVSLPESYRHDSAARYAVVVVLDGESQQEVVAAVSRFYADVSMLPELIVVGVRNTNRMRDLTPVALSGSPPGGDTGGAERFSAFLADEFFPWLDRSFRTAPVRILVGHSIGGLFAVYALGSHTSLFNGYLLMAPATWWNDGLELRKAKSVLTSPAARQTRVVTVNAQPLGVDTTRWGGDAPMVRELHVTGQTHASMAVDGITAGLRAILQDFRPSEWKPGTAPGTMLARHDSLVARIGWSPPIDRETFVRVFGMSLMSRMFDDAAQVLDRMDAALGRTRESGALRDTLRMARQTPVPPTFVPLLVPPERPSSRDAARFIGHWVSLNPGDPHDVDVRASGDSIIVHDVLRFPSGDRYDADDPIIQLTRGGTLEWGLPFFRGIAALLVLQGRILPDGTLETTRQVRGWVPLQPGPNMSKVERFRKDG